MSDISASLFNFFNNLLMISFISSVLIIVILLLRFILKDKLSLRAQYALWFLVLIRLICPYIPESPISIYRFITPNAVSTVKTVSHRISSYGVETILNTASANDESKQLNATESKKYKYTYDAPDKSMNNSMSLYEVLLFIWLIGFILSIGRLILMEIIFSKRVKKGKIIKKGYMYNTFIDCKTILNINKKVFLIYTPYVNGPALYGILNPKILIPTDMMQKIEKKQLKYVFMHEFTHLKNRDEIINIITVILTCIHWFNPIIRIAFNNMREEREIVCDGKVLLALGDKNANEYGKVIVGLMENIFKTERIPLVTGIISHNLKRRIIMIKMFEKNKYKFSALGLAVVMVVGGMFMTTAKANDVDSNNSSYSNVITDKIDYPFVNDSSVIGTWGSVDFVKNINDFEPNKRNTNYQLYLTQLSFSDDGKIALGFNADSPKGYEGVTWTKDIVIDSRDKTASKYIIKEVDGKQYMFFEWKSGDYTYRHMKPYYYVLEKGYVNNNKVDIKGKSDTVNKQVVFDKTDYPFVNDDDVKGEWKSVDFVDEIDNFNPDKKMWNGSLYLQALIFNDNGNLESKIEGETYNIPKITWTKDMVINKIDSTASKYTIKEINGETYMFYEWKSGDYTIRNMKPEYYVLKKVSK